MTARRSFRALLVAGLIVFVGAVAAFVPDAEHASAADDPEALLERARTASAHQSFTGVVAVRWMDGGTVHRALVHARAANGSIQVGEGTSRVGARGLERWVGDDRGWHELWKEPEGARTPRPGRHWDLRIAGSEAIAGRVATRIDVRDRETGAVRARFLIEPTQGLLLGRDVLDERGEPIRWVRFLSIEDVVDAAPLSLPRTAQGAPPQTIADAPDGYPAPANLLGYRLLSRYEHDDGSVQLFYSDGVFTLSVFEQAGDPDWSSLPVGHDRKVEGTRTRSYSTATSSVVVWGEDGLTITCVGDAPDDEMAEVVRTLHTTDDSSVLDEVADFVLGPFGWS